MGDEEINFLGANGWKMKKLILLAPADIGIIGLEMPQKIGPLSCLYAFIPLQVLLLQLAS